MARDLTKHDGAVPEEHNVFAGDPDYDLAGVLTPEEAFAMEAEITEFMADRPFATPGDDLPAVRTQRTAAVRVLREMRAVKGPDFMIADQQKRLVKIRRKMQAALAADRKVRNSMM